MSDLKIQGEASLSTEGAEAALNRLGDKAGQMAKRVEGAADQAGKAVDGIGTGAEEGAKKFSRAESRTIDSIKRITQEMQLLGKSASEKFEIKIAAKGLDPAVFAPYIAQLKAVEAAQNGAASSQNKLGVSAAQTAAALRGVPAQMTDIVTALQGGQQPITVLLQQGGQLKDMFGGIGPAARAMGGYIIGLVNPLTLAAAGAGALAYAFHEGSKESTAYANALVISGNAAGATGLQLQAMAARISAANGITKGAAAEAILQFASSGRFAAEQIEKFSASATSLQKEAGVAIKDTVKDFVELGKAPVTASLKLNESLNYLTASTYAQIKSLEDQGKTIEAGVAAQKAYADAINSRVPQMVENLGYVESAWRKIRGAMGAASDAFFDVGRKQDPAAVIAKQLEDTYTRIERLRKLGGGKDTQLRIAEQQRIAASLSLEAENLAKVTQAKEKDAAADVKRAAGVAAADRLNKYLDDAKYADKATKLSLELAKEDAAFAEAVQGFEKSSKEYTDALKRHKANVAQINEQNKDKSPVNNEIANIRAAIIADQAYLEQLRTRGAEADKVNEAQKLAIQLEKQLEGTLDAKTRAVKETMLVEAKKRAGILEEIDFTKDLIKQVDDARKAKERDDKASADHIKSINDKAAGVEAEIAAYGLGKEALAQFTIARLMDERATLAQDEGSEARIVAIDKEIAALKRLAKAQDGLAAKDEVAKAAKKAQEDWARAAKDIERSITDALMRGFEGGKGFLQNLIDTARNLFKTLILRPVISAVVSPVAQTITGALGIAGAASAATGGANAIGSAAGALSGLGALGTFGSSITGTAAGIWGSGASISSAVSAGFELATAGSFAQGAGMIVGALGPIAAGIGALVAIANFTRGETRSGGQYGYSFNGSTVVDNRAGTVKGAGGVGATFLQGPSGGDPYAKEAQAAINATVKGIQDTLKAVGSAAVLTGFSAGYESSGKGQGGVFAGGVFADGRGFGESGRDFNANGTPFETTSSQSPDAKTAIENFALDLQQATIQALQSAIDVPKVVKDVLKDVDAESLTADAAKGILTQIDAIVGTVNGFRDALKTLPFEDLKNLSFDAAAGLIAAAGGMDKLGAGLNAFYENFYTEAEKSANLSSQVSAALSSIGKSMPDLTKGAEQARADFRRLVEGSMRDTSAEGQRATAVLLSVAGAFATLTPVAKEAKSAADAAADAAKEAAEKAKKNAEALKEANAEYERTVAAVQSATQTAASSFQAFVSQVTTASNALDQVGLSIVEKYRAAVSSQTAADKVVADARASLTAGYISASDKVEQAQQRIIDINRQVAESMRKLGGDLRDFLTTLNTTELGGGSKRDQLDALKAQFGVQSSLARAGDAEAAAKLPAIAQSLISLQREFSTNGNDFSLFVAGIRNTISEVAAIAEAKGSSAAPVDPLQAATAELTKAIAEQEAWKNAVISAGASLTASNTDILKGYRDAIRAQENASDDIGYWAEILRRVGISVDDTGDSLEQSGEALLTQYRQAERDLRKARDDLAEANRIKGDLELRQTTALEAFANQVRELNAAVAAMSAATIARAAASAGTAVYTSSTVSTAAGSSYTQNALNGASGTSNAPARPGGVDEFGNTPFSQNLPTNEDLVRSWYANNPDATKNPAAADVAYWEAQLANPNLGQYDVKRNFAEAVAVITGKPLRDITGFAGGGFHAGGVRVVGERGIEVEATGPSRVWSNSQMGRWFTTAGRDNEVLIEEQRLTRSAIESLDRRLSAIEGNTGKAASTLDRVSRGGTTIATVPA